MNAHRFCQLAGRLMGCPAAPYHESGPRAAAEEICAQHGLGCERDDYGNLLVCLQTDLRPRPLVLAAHLDHPGFEIIRPISATRWRARFVFSPRPAAAADARRDPGNSREKSGRGETI